MKNSIEVIWSADSLKNVFPFCRKRLEKLLHVTAFGLIFIIFLVGCGKESPRENLMGISEENNSFLETNEEDDVKDDATVEEAGLIVYICGQVMNSGVFTLPEGSRINDVLLLAGGFSEDADISAVNLAQPITDGMKIYIPKPGELAADESAEQTNGNVKVNINQAGVSELCTLPGVGESRAKDIIAYREKNGNFQKTEDLMKVSGIKESTFQKVKEYICIGN